MLLTSEELLKYRNPHTLFIFCSLLFMYSRTGTVDLEIQQTKQRTDTLYILCMCGIQPCSLANRDNSSPFFLLHHLS